MGQALAAAGLTARALVVARKLERTAPTAVVPDYQMALLHAALGQTDLAFADLDDELARGAVTVKALVVCAPLLGLLGTVTGMMETFSSLGDMALFSRSGGIAGGVAEALLTTELGLAVAIPGLVVGKLLQHRADRLALELDQVKDRLCGEGAR